MMLHNVIETRVIVAPQNRTARQLHNLTFPLCLGMWRQISYATPSTTYVTKTFAFEVESRCLGWVGGWVGHAAPSFQLGCIIFVLCFPHSVSMIPVVRLLSQTSPYELAHELHRWTCIFASFLLKSSGVTLPNVCLHSSIRCVANFVQVLHGTNNFFAFMHFRMQCTMVLVYSHTAWLNRDTFKL